MLYLYTRPTTFWSLECELRADTPITRGEMLSIFEGAGVPKSLITRILVMSIVFAAITIVASIIVLRSINSSISTDELLAYLKVSAFAFVLAGII